MTIIKFQSANNVHRTLNLLSHAANELLNNENDISVHFPTNCFIGTDAIALLTSWLLSQQHDGREIKVLEGSTDHAYLARMHFHQILGLKVPNHNRLPISGRFIPISLIKDEKDVKSTVENISDIVLQQFDNAPELLPALEWAVYEIVDNISSHSKTKSPGVVFAQYYPNMNQLDIAICDSGIGIRQSLSEKYRSKDDADAITMALKRDVTRNTKSGLGNGMAGSREIIKINRGSFNVRSGSSLYRFNRAVVAGFIKVPNVPGTGVLLSFKVNQPVSLSDTWIGSVDWSYIDQEAKRIVKDGIVVKDVCNHTGSRPPATRLRRKILAILPDAKGAITIDFSGVDSLSSSFLDELLGLMYVELGKERFNKKIIVAGMSDLHLNIANNVIRQRLAIVSDKKTT